ncbi:phospholipase/carboxylesterase [Clostridium sp. CAG:448]|nr:phospholipase/carboxylesterase [Clostridium sp. CAG:448]
MEQRIYQSMQYGFSGPREVTGGEKLPLLIYLHGAGGRGHDLHAVRVPYTLETALAEQHLPVCLAAPLCEWDNWFCVFSQLTDWIRYAATLPGIDPDRIILMGASMGGYATWTMLMCAPELFAAGVPICGGGMPWNAARLKHIPIRAYHGALDTTVDVCESVRMCNAVRAAGGDVSLTVFPTAGHNAWDPAIRETDLLAWIAQQRRTK